MSGNIILADDRGVGLTPANSELESILNNLDEQAVIPPLRAAYAAVQRQEHPRFEEETLQTIALQEQWNHWCAQREILREEIRRGKELLLRSEEETAAIRNSLEDWPQYERECGRNPIHTWLQSLATRERLREFMPGWLERRQKLLTELEQTMDALACAHGWKCSPGSQPISSSRAQSHSKSDNRFR